MRFSLAILLVFFTIEQLWSRQLVAGKPCTVDKLLKRIKPILYNTITTPDFRHFEKFHIAVNLSVSIVDEANEQQDEPKNIITLNVDDKLRLFGMSYQLVDSERGEFRSINITDQCRDNSTQVLVLTLAEDLPSGSFGFLKYFILGMINKTSPRGLYARNSTYEDNSLVVANYSNHGARTIMPCLDEPHYKASHQVLVVTNLTQIATSCSLERDSQHKTGDQILYYFKRTHPMSFGEFSFEIRPNIKSSLD